MENLLSLANAADLVSDTPPPRPGPPPPMPWPQTPPQKQATPDHHIQLEALLKVNTPYQVISSVTGLSIRQIRYYIQHSIGHTTARKRPGRPLLLSPDEIQRVIQFITSSKKGRRMPFD